MGNLALPTAPSRGGLPWEEIFNGEVAGEALTAGQVVVKDTNGRWVKADRDTDASYAYVTLHTASGLGSPISVMARGVLGGYTGLTPGTLYYLSDTAGSVCPVADLSAGQNYVPVMMAWTPTSMYIDRWTVQLPNDTLVIASPARGNVIYKGASAWSVLANGTKGYSLVSGGSGADPSYAAPRQVQNVGPLADQAAAATVVVKFGAPATGRKWVMQRLHVLSGTTADATANLKAAGTTMLAAPVAVDGDTEITTFADSEAAAGQAVTVDLVTAADTGDLDAAVLILEYADLPA